MDPDLAPYGYEYDPAHFPWGLRCADCNRLIEEGDRYASKLEGMTEIGGEPAPVTLIVCLECALTPEAADA